VTKRKKSRDLEHHEQAAYFDWTLKTNTLDRWPELILAFAIPNGGGRPGQTRTDKKGKVVRFSLEAQKMKREGVKPGVPDIMVPVASGGFHGLYIEMKVKGNKPTPDQVWWHEQLAAQGYAVFVCYSYPEARAVTERYMKGGYRRVA